MTLKRTLSSLLLLSVLLYSCTEDGSCYYAGNAADIRIDYKFIALTSEDEHLVELELVYDKIPEEQLLYTWEVNGIRSHQKTMQLIYTEPITGFIKVSNEEDHCFIYKDIAMELDLSDCCSSLGDVDFMEIAQKKNSNCAFPENSIELTADFKGPANMELLYEWSFDGQKYTDRSFQLSGVGQKSGHIKVTNPVDNCYLIKPIELDFDFGGGSIGNSVWLDTNQNSIFDSSDLSLEGVTVELYSFPARILLATTVTDRAGNYLFQNLLATRYVIKFHRPSGFDFVGKQLSTDASIDSDAHPDGFTDPILLGPCVTNLSIDAGLRRS